MLRAAVVVIAAALAAGLDCPAVAPRVVRPARDHTVVAPHFQLELSARAAEKEEVFYCALADGHTRCFREPTLSLSLPVGAHEVQPFVVAADGACAAPPLTVHVQCSLPDFAWPHGELFETRATHYWAHRGVAATLQRVAELRDRVATEHSLLCFPSPVQSPPPPPDAWPVAAVARWASGAAYADAGSLPGDDAELVLPSVRRLLGRDEPQTALSAAGEAHLHAWGAAVQDVVARGVAGNVTVIDGPGEIAVAQAAADGRFVFALGDADPLERRLDALGVPTDRLVFVSGPRRQRALELLQQHAQRLAAAYVGGGSGDCDAVYEALNLVLPVVVPGGVVAFDEACMAEVMTLRRATTETAPLQRMGPHGALWVKAAPTTTAALPAPRPWAENAVFARRVPGTDVLDAALEGLLGVRDVPATLAEEQAWLQAFTAASAAFSSRLAAAAPDIIEGHIGAYRAKMLAVARAVRDPRVECVVEIGFNAGHSALLYLLANPRVRLLSFDLGEHPYVRPAAALLSRLFPGRFELVLGDSRETVPAYASPPACQLVSVDGGHEGDVPARDLQNARRFADPRFHTLLVDDAFMPAVRAPLAAPAARLRPSRIVHDVECACWWLPEGSEVAVPCEAFAGAVLGRRVEGSGLWVGSFV